MASSATVAQALSGQVPGWLEIRPSVATTRHSAHVSLPDRADNVKVGQPVILPQLSKVTAPSEPASVRCTETLPNSALNSCIGDCEHSDALAVSTHQPFDQDKPDLRRETRSLRLTDSERAVVSEMRSSAAACRRRCSVNKRENEGAARDAITESTARAARTSGNVTPLSLVATKVSPQRCHKTANAPLHCQGIMCHQPPAASRLSA